MAVMAVNAPGLKHALDVAFIARSADVIDHFIATAFLECPADTAGDEGQRLRPIDRLPFPFAAWANAPQRLKDAVGIVNLIDRRRTFGTEPAPTAWMQGIALEFADYICLFIYISKQAAGRFAVEAGRGNQPIVPLHTSVRPAPRLNLYPVIPLFRRRRAGERAGSMTLRLGRCLRK